LRRDPQAYLGDIRTAADEIVAFTAGKDAAVYLSDPLLRAAVERKFSIIGEALTQLARLDPALAERITDYRRIIGFRNILVHGYADVDDTLVWDAVVSRLPRLRIEVAALLPDDSAHS
jgi:uncharacterized protein with HEPN domain